MRLSAADDLPDLVQLFLGLGGTDRTQCVVSLVARSQDGLDHVCDRAAQQIQPYRVFLVGRQLPREVSQPVRLEGTADRVPDAAGGTSLPGVARSCCTPSPTPSSVNWRWAPDTELRGSVGERIYTHGGDTPMAGVLIYTASHRGAEPPIDIFISSPADERWVTMLPGCTLRTSRPAWPWS